MAILGHPVTHGQHPIAATTVVVLLALLVVAVDVAVGSTVLGWRDALYANFAGLLVTAILALAYSRRSHG